MWGKQPLIKNGQAGNAHFLFGWHTLSALSNATDLLVLWGFIVCFCFFKGSRAHILINDKTVSSPRLLPNLALSLPDFPPL